MKKKLVILLIIFLGIGISPVYAVSLKQVFDMGMAAYESGDYQKASKAFEKVLEMKPNFAPAYNALGICAKAAGKSSDEVVAFFKKGIEADPNYAPSYENLGKVYYSLADFDKAEETTLKAVELNQDLMTTKLSLAWIYLIGKSEPGKAIPYFRQAVDNNNKLPYAYLGLGMAYFLDDQRALVLEMITALRNIDREDLAKELETMLKEKRYIVPKNLEVSSGVGRSKGVEISAGNIKEDDAFIKNLNPEDMNVKIRSPGSAGSPQGSVQDGVERPSGAERIQALRKKGASIKSDHSDELPADY